MKNQDHRTPDRALRGSWSDNAGLYRITASSDKGLIDKRRYSPWYIFSMTSR